MKNLRTGQSRKAHLMNRTWVQRTTMMIMMTKMMTMMTIVRGHQLNEGEKVLKVTAYPVQSVADRLLMKKRGTDIFNVTTHQEEKLK
jgi:hypothetical protein